MLDKTNAGRRVELLHTTDPYTDLKPGDQGTIRFERFDGTYDTVAIDWDNGSTLTLIPATGDHYRYVGTFDPIAVKRVVPNPVEDDRGLDPS